MRLIGITLALWLCFAVLVIGARTYGSTRIEPNPLKEFGFDVCDGQPCFMGIIPGVTTVEEAKSLLSKHFEVTPWGPGEDFAADADPIRIFFGIIPATQRVAGFEYAVLSKPNFPRFDSFLAMYGLPCAVGAYPSDTYFELIYEHGVLRLSTVGGHIRLSSLVIRSSELTHCENPGREGSGTMRWMGFATVERYQRK